MTAEPTRPQKPPGLPDQSFPSGPVLGLLLRAIAELCLLPFRLLGAWLTHRSRQQDMQQLIARHARTPSRRR